MTCPNCSDLKWVFGDPCLPGGNPDDMHLRSWVIPCPVCSPDQTLTEVARLVAEYQQAGRWHSQVGWALVYFFTPDAVKAWPFVVWGDERDGISTWWDHEPSVAEVATLYINDEDV